MYEVDKQRGDGVSEKLPDGELHFTCHIIASALIARNITLSDTNRSVKVDRDM